MISPWRVPPSHDELFLERYGRLLALCLKLTGHDRQLAEDLLHDAFVQFTLVRPDLESIRNIDGYLYGMLRNMHLSHLRAAKCAGGGLRLVDYDTIDLSLGTVTLMNHITARDELRAVCRFACVRKETSKSASVLILRFFHGYYPAEIALVIGSPRKAVDDWIRIARREAKAWLQDPTQVAPINRTGPRPDLEFSTCLTIGEFVSDLRSAIFSAGISPCFTDDELGRMYDENGNASPDCRALAHIVGCVKCLDRVNYLLGLAPLSERFPNDMLGPDSGDKSGGSGFEPPSDSTVRRMRSRAKAVFEHTPNELRVAVNGSTVSTGPVGSALCEQVIEVSLNEPIAFVEIFSEQGVRLLFVPVESPPDGADLQPVRVELSDHRSLEVELSFRNRLPQLRTSYADPLYEGSPAISPSPAALKGPSNAEDSDEATELAAVLSQPVPVPDFRMPEFSQRLSGLFWFFRSLFRPGIITAALAVCLILALVLFRTPAPPVLAAELLHRAIASETAAGNTEQIIHRTVYMDERIPRSSQLLRRNRIDLWTNAGGGVTARRVYDEKDRLLAGEWIQADGSRVVYRPHREPEHATDPEAQLETLIADGTFWRIDPSARTFSALADASGAFVKDQDGTYVISYEVGDSDEAGDKAHLVKMVLTLTKSDLHAIEQLVVVRSAAGLREYHFVEYGIERLPRSNVSPGMFEPDGEFLRGGSRGATAPERLELPPPPAAEAERTGPVRFAAVEMDALYRLHQAGVCTREPSSISMTPDGGLRVEVIVETEKRKAELSGL
ncbi:MAG TPA: sigma-70 family RNA polymerase sigma factor, partial [Blastocatellia bacterium]|nr:sigma-70 family RNA polymerase sigma factor [Blastocatellia bacterium]